MYESWLCSGCGQDMRYSMDYRLEDHWAALDAVRCQACTALAVAQKGDEGKDHPHALRHAVGLREGWREVVNGEA